MPYVLSADEWDKDLQKTVIPKRSTPDRAKKLKEIDEKLQKELKLVLKTAERLESYGDYSSKELAECYHKQKEGQPFCEYIKRVVKIVQGEKRFGTAGSYQYSGVSFLKYLEGRDIGIDKITSELIKDYERWLESEHKTKNTISCYMRSLRAIYNRAIREKVFMVKKKHLKPFSGVFTGNAKTPKRATGVDEISRLMNLPLPQPLSTGEEGDSPPLWGEAGGEVTTATNLHLSCDIFLFSFFTQGMAFVDAANLKKENIKDGFIEYNRKKTNQPITIKLEDRIKTIIDRYATPDSDYVFPILRQHQDSDEYVKWRHTVNSLAVYNRNLGKLAKLAGIKQHLTSYVARHSWASIASQEGIPIGTISRGLGHESERTTRIYISQLDFSDVSRANRQILSNFATNSPLLLPAEPVPRLQKKCLLL